MRMCLIYIFIYLFENITKKHQTNISHYQQPFFLFMPKNKEF